MTMAPRLRKFALTAHITSSVGLLGAIACFLALVVAGLASQDAPMVRAAYLAMELTTWFVIVPLAGVAAETALSSADLRKARIELVIHASGGLLVLLVPIVLSVYKPLGMTGYGWRKQHEQRGLSPRG
jgi:hypothetical protein